MATELWEHNISKMTPVFSFPCDVLSFDPSVEGRLSFTVTGAEGRNTTLGPACSKCNNNTDLNLIFLLSFKIDQMASYRIVLFSDQ